MAVGNYINRWRTILKNEVLLIVKRGNKFVCPFCNYSSSGLKQIGTDSKANREKHIIGAGLRNAGCYKCGSTDRERLVYLYLRDVAKVFIPGNKISLLHIAPEKNLISLLRNSDNIDYVAGDSWIDKHGYYKGIEYIDIRNIPYPDNTFDVIVCNHVLEHIPEDVTAMRELYRGLKPGGQAILQVPISYMIDSTFEDKNVTEKKERREIFGQQDHVRIYGPDYADRLSTAGFNVHQNEMSSDPKYSKNGLNAEEKLFVGCKVKG